MLFLRRHDPLPSKSWTTFHGKNTTIYDFFARNRIEEYITNVDNRQKLGKSAVGGVSEGQYQDPWPFAASSIFGGEANFPFVFLTNACWSGFMKSLVVSRVSSYWEYPYSNGWSAARKIAIRLAESQKARIA